MCRECSTHGSDKKYTQYCGWKTCGKEPLGRSRRRWKDNIRMDLMEIWCEVVDWMHLAKDKD